MATFYSLTLFSVKWLIDLWSHYGVAGNAVNN